MIWIITAMIWHADISQPTYSTFQEVNFNSKIECLDYVFWNRGDLVYKLVQTHGTKDNKQIRTWSFFCEGKQLDEV